MNKQIYFEIVDEFVNEFNSLIDAMVESKIEILSILHTIKGSSATVGFVRTSYLAQKVESAVMDGFDVNIALAAKGLTETFSKEFTFVAQLIETFSDNENNSSS